MGVNARIIVWILTGMLIKAGIPPNIAEILAGDPGVHMAVEQVVALVAGVVIGVVAFLWRKAALRFGWST